MTHKIRLKVYRYSPLNPPILGNLNLVPPEFYGLHASLSVFVSIVLSPLNPPILRDLNLVPPEFYGLHTSLSVFVSIVLSPLNPPILGDFVCKSFILLSPQNWGLGGYIATSRANEANGDA
jgi:hypothetical protein